MPDGSTVLDLVYRRLEELEPQGPAEVAVRAGAAYARYREGMSSLQELRLELESLGYRGPRLLRYIRSAVLDRRRELTATLGDIATQEIRMGVLDGGTYQARLVEAGYTLDQARLMRRREELRRQAPVEE